MNQKQHHSPSGGGGRDEGCPHEHEIAIAVQSVKSSIDAADKNTNTHREKSLFWIKVTGGAAIFYTIVTAALFVVSLYTAHVASEAANAASQQAAVASDTEKRQLRAYVGTIPGDLENFGDPKTQTFTITRKNFGITPAYNLTWAAVGQSIIANGGPIPWTNTTPAPIKDLFTLFPTMEAPLHIEGTPISTEVISAFRQNKNLKFIYFWTINYDDAFGQSHFSRYCWMFSYGKFGKSDADGCLPNNDSN